MSGGKGEDDTPEGWTFLNICSFVRPELTFLAESESEVATKSEFCMLVFWCCHFSLSVRHQIPCDQGVSRNMLWRFES